MNPLDLIIAEEVHACGPIEFARFMELALYHPEHGYYSAGERRTGWSADFVTSPELDRAYGELWGRAFEGIWHECGRPSEFDVIEVGPGEASLAAAVLGSVGRDFAHAVRYRMVERVPEVARRQQAVLAGRRRVSWVSSIAEVPRATAGCVFANEVVDNMPVRLLERRGTDLLELCVGVVDDELDFVARPAPQDLVAILEEWEAELPDGHRAEVPVEALRFVASATNSIERGAIVIVDYGDHAANLFERPAGTLLSYSAAGVDDRLLEHPGHKDVTAHANWSALEMGFKKAGAGVAGPLRQRDVLKRLGADRLTDRLRSDADAALARGAGAEAFRALARRGAVGVLTDASGLGGFGVIAGLKAISPPSWLST